MRYFKYYEPDNKENVVEVVMSEDDIRESYYPFWKEQMIAVSQKYGDGKFNPNTAPAFEACLEDWISAHWAEEIDNTENEDCSYYQQYE